MLDASGSATLQPVLALTQLGNLLPIASRRLCATGVLLAPTGSVATNAVE